MASLLDSIKMYGIPYALFFAFWMILAPKATQQSVFIGLAVSGLVLVYSRAILFSAKEVPFYQARHFYNLLGFFGLLLVEIVKANLVVVKIVLSPRLPIQPQFVRVPMRFKENVNKVIYANSVTLTPGTLTVEVTDDYFVIHALTDDAAAGLSNSFIEAWVMKQEGLEK